MRSFGLTAVIALLGIAISGSALAHTGVGISGGLSSGFQHPIRGFDHLLAMLAVGLWGAQIGGRSMWTLPVVFPLVMAVGGLVGTSGFVLPHVELGIAFSVLGLGAAIALGLRPPEMIAAAAVGVFAIFHGYAHGAELPTAADPMAYGAGFVLATGLIHVAGIGIGLGLGRLLDGWVTRGLGVLIAIAGLGFVFT